MFEVVATGKKADIQAAWDALAWAEPTPTPAVDHQELRANVWQLRGYSETRDLAEQARDIIKDLCPDLSPVVAQLGDIDWVAKSLEGLPPVRAGKLVIVGEHAKEQVIGGQRPLIIEAGAAFGTGHHGTTLGAMTELIDITKRTRPANLLDLGTGTGVLAIAGRKLGIGHIIGTDIDPKAIEVAKENADKNQCKGLQFIVCRGTNNARLHANAPYDLICANIIAPVLKPLARHIPALLAQDGHIILSGLLHHQVSSTLSHYTAAGLRVVSRREIEGWHTIVLTKSTEDPA